MMIRSTTYTHILIAAASALALSACVANSGQPGSNQYGAGYDNTQPGNVTTGPYYYYYYRGSESNGTPVNNDATINANVIQAISQASGTGAANLQVTTLNGVVTLRGVADTQLIAQTDVQAARQVPGVQRVDYDIKVLRR